MMNFLPESSRPNERAILILYYLMGITGVHDIQKALGHKSNARIYKTLAKYRGKMDLKMIHEEKEKLTDQRQQYPLVTLYKSIP